MDKTMQKKDILELLLKGNDDQIFIAKSKLSDLTGIGWDKLTEILQDTKYLGYGTKNIKRYLIKDVAEALAKY